MAEEEKMMPSKGEKLAQANKNRREFYANSIKMLKEELENSETSNWDLLLCEAKMSKLQADFDKFELKAMAIWCDEVSDEQKKIFNEENSEVANMFFSAKTKIQARILLLTAAEKLGKLVESPEKNDIAQNQSIAGTLTKTSAQPENKDGGDVIGNKLNRMEIANEAQQHSQATTTTTADAQTEPNIVKVEIEKFSIGNWNRFESDFMQKIGENDQIDAPEKFSALAQACINTEAIHILQLADGNWRQAFSNMKSTYGSAYRQTQWYVRKLLNLQRLEQPNSHELMNFVKAIDEINDKLEAIGKNVSSIVPFVALEKIDIETTHAWERYMKVLQLSSAQAGGVDEFMPSWQSVKDFLVDEANILISLGSWLNTSTKVQTPKEVGENTEFSLEAKANHTQSASRPGEPMTRFNSWQRVNEFCDCSTKHPLNRCIPFKALNMEQREADLQTRGYCIRCLQKEHIGFSCLDSKHNADCPNCRQKGVKHNSLFCPVAFRMYYTGTKPKQ